MFENIKIKDNYLNEEVYISRFIASCKNVGIKIGYFNENEKSGLNAWLHKHGFTDENCYTFAELANCGKMELEKELYDLKEQFKKSREVGA